MNPFVPVCLLPRSSWFARWAAIALAFASSESFAWGPHTEIAQAALTAMGQDDPLAKRLGPDTKRLAQYVWMADWRQQLLVRTDEVFYADDVLLFPAAAKHYQHICPEVKQTYAPYFRRALQALRTESAHNAARWIGSLLHFTTDTGSPPHALGILGPTHSKMENWVNAKLIHIPAYKPQLLGADDSEAEAGFLRRMDGLIEYCKARAERCGADVEADRREAVEPVVLEAALETARVTADLLHTLGVLASPNSGDASLSGRVVPPRTDHPVLSRLPMRIVLSGTAFSTLTSADGTFAFHDLPAGEYRPIISALGRVIELASVTLAAGTSITLDTVDLSSNPDSNLVRNPAFSLRWVSAEGFDHWSPRMPPARLAGANPMRDWEGEWIPLTNGTAYQLSAHWKATAGDGEGPRVFVRTKAKPPYASPPTDSSAVTPGGREIRLTGTPEAAWAQVIVRSRQLPDAVLEEVCLQARP